MVLPTAGIARIVKVTEVPVALVGLVGLVEIDAEIDTAGSGLTVTVAFADSARAAAPAVAAPATVAITSAVVFVVRKTRAVPVASVVAASVLSDP